MRPPVQCSPGQTKIGHHVTFPTISSPLARALAERNYDKLTPAQVKALANGVNALSEPLSRLTAALVK